MIAPEVDLFFNLRPLAMLLMQKYVDYDVEDIRSFLSIYAEVLINENGKPWY